MTQFNWREEFQQLVDGDDFLIKMSQRHDYTDLDCQKLLAFIEKVEQEAYRHVLELMFNSNYECEVSDGILQQMREKYWTAVKQAREELLKEKS